jgi:hypothetical protein
MHLCQYVSSSLQMEEYTYFVSHNNNVLLAGVET